MQLLARIPDNRIDVMHSSLVLQLRRNQNHHTRTLKTNGVNVIPPQDRSCLYHRQKPFSILQARYGSSSMYSSPHQRLLQCKQRMISEDVVCTPYPVPQSSYTHRMLSNVSPISTSRMGSRHEQRSQLHVKPVRRDAHMTCEQVYTSKGL